LKTGILGIAINFKMLDSESRYNVETTLTAKKPPFFKTNCPKVDKAVILVKSYSKLAPVARIYAEEAAENRC
jgi:hypothetical protein